MAVSNSLFLQLTTFRNVVKSRNVTANLLRRITNRMDNVSLYSTSAKPAQESSSEKPVERVPRKMSKAMMAYLERAKAHDEFIQKEKEDYQIGKRHLANMMGEDPEFFTQTDVDKAIEYLFPSGLYDKAARPIMKPPEEIFPPRKAAEFDETGRPFSSLFYTAQPSFYKMLYDIVEEWQRLNLIEDDMIKKGNAPDPNITLDMGGSEWLDQAGLEKLLLERMRETDFEYFKATIERLANHPYAHLARDFIMKYRRELKSHVTALEMPELQYDEAGRPFVTVPDCMRKTARGIVTLTGKGTGKITVNGIPVEQYFSRHQDLEQDKDNLLMLRAISRNRINTFDVLIETICTAT